MLVEVALKIVDPASGALDGATLEWYPAGGRFLTPNEMLQWIDNGSEPDLSMMGLNIADAFRHKVQWSRYWIDPTLNPETAARLRWDARSDTVNRRWRTLPQSTKDGQIAMIQEMIADRQQWRLDKIQDGAHERWGQHLLKHSGIAVMEVPPHVAVDMVKTPVVPRGPYYEEFTRPARKRRFTIDYRTLLSAESVADWLDGNKQVLPATLDPAWDNRDAWTASNLDTVTL